MKKKFDKTKKTCPKNLTAGKKGFVAKLTDGIITVCAAFTLINYIVYLIKLIVVPEQLTAYVLTFLILTGVLLPFILRKKLKKAFPRIYAVGKAVYGLCAVFYTVTFAVMCCMIFLGDVSKAEDFAPADPSEKLVFVIYGAKVSGTDAENSYPGKSLKLRLDCAAELLENTENSVCIVTGGMGPDEYRAEGEVMADYLISVGISPDRIYIDNTSKNTVENIENAMTVIENNSLSDRTVVCISTNFHIPRIKYLCKKAGFNAQHFVCAPAPNLATLYPSLVREYMSYGKIILGGL